MATFAADLDETHARLRTAVSTRLKTAAEDLATPALRLRGSARHQLAVVEGRLALARSRIITGTGSIMARENAVLEHAMAQIRSGPVRLLRERDRRLDGVAGQVRALDPARVLQRGFSVTRDASGGVVRDSAQVKAGERLTTELATGSVSSVVEDEP